MTQITLPILQLSPREIQFPSSVFSVSFTRLQAFLLLSSFASITKDESILNFLSTIEQDEEDGLIMVKKLSLNAVSGMRLVHDQNNASLSLLSIVMGCLPGYHYTSKHRVMTVSRLIGIKDNDSSVEIIFHGLQRAALVKTLSEDEAVVDLVQEDNSSLTSVDQLSVMKFLQSIKLFIECYALLNKSNTGHLNKRQLLKRNFLLLSPMANVLYIQLTKDVNILKMINKFGKSLARGANMEKQLHAMDCLVSIFPFTLSQKNTMLAELDNSKRVGVFNDLIQFGISIFEELDNLDIVVDNWNSLDSKLLQSKIILTHLKSLKFLVDDFNHKSRATPRMSSTDNSQQEQDEDINKLDQFIKNIDNYHISPDGKKLIIKDYKKLKKLTPNNSEYHTLLSYLETIEDIPWNSPVNQGQIDLVKAQLQLDKDHYGLDNVKDRILEYLAILNLHNKIKSEGASKAPILLLTGPPGVGKTSLARSIATTLDRKFQRISLGGLKDESEIKGHRRTYIGALPGMIIQALRKAQTNNVVILLDEIDKVVGGNTSVNKVNGDPALALLEVLDPEQNSNFTDHYIGFPVDLSNVAFLCTSNDHYLLSAPLLDRMELLEINGYNYMEKVEIVKNFILPRQIVRSGLPPHAVQLSDEVILQISINYTRESGVRNLERTISAICRGKAVEYSKLLGSGSATEALPKGYDPVVLQDQAALYIGIPPHIKDELKLEQILSSKSGVVNGLSYNSDGSGSKLIFEMISLPSSSFQMTMTGRLGEVLRESGKIASSLVKSILNKMLLNKDNASLLKFLNSNEFHLHVPLGSISKDGPSAGITMTLCLLSLVIDKPVPGNIAMTGEITLRGLILPIGGVMEKLLGAHLTQKVSKVLLPRLNRKDIIEYYLRFHKQNTEAILKEEEILLSRGDKFVHGAPEKLILLKFNIELIYVEELNDVMKLCWDGEYQINTSVPLTQQELHL